MKKFTFFIIIAFLLNFIGCDSPVTDIQSGLPINEETPIDETTEESAEEELTVIFMDGDTEISSVVINNGNTVNRPEDPEKDDYRFIDWYSDTELSILFDFDTIVTENINIYSKWEEIDLYPGKIISNECIGSYGSMYGDDWYVVDSTSITHYQKNGSIHKYRAWTERVDANSVVYYYYITYVVSDNTFDNFGSIVFSGSVIKLNIFITVPERPSITSIGYPKNYEVEHFSTLYPNDKNLYFWHGQLVSFHPRYNNNYGSPTYIQENELMDRLTELKKTPATIKEDQFIDDWSQSGYCVFITPKEFGPIRGIEDMNSRELFKQECILDMDVLPGESGIRTAIEIVINGNDYYAYIMGYGINSAGSNGNTIYTHLAIRY